MLYRNKAKGKGKGKGKCMIEKEKGNLNYHQKEKILLEQVVWFDTSLPKGVGRELVEF